VGRSDKLKMSYFESRLNRRNILFQSWCFFVIYIVIFYRVMQIKQSQCYGQEIANDIISYISGAIIPAAVIWSLPLIIVSIPIDWFIWKVKFLNKLDVIGAEALVCIIILIYLFFRFLPMVEFSQVNECIGGVSMAYLDVLYSILPLIMSVFVFRALRRLILLKKRGE